ncbi:MAG TPA: hypothetical protein PLY71_03815 [Candidatus Fermentibacter daniensis]|nr:hypothetical protein [Candidatus Fermentibacter daniensis]
MICTPPGLLLAASLISSASFTGSPPLPPQELLEIVSTVNDSTVAALHDAVLGWYLQQGYPFASIGCYMATEDSLTAAIVPGRHAALEGFRFEGLEGTRPNTLVRLFRGETGAPYDPEALRQWRARLARLPYIAWVGPGELMLGPGGNLVVVQRVIEGPSGSFSASLGVSGRGGSDEMEGEGLLDVTNLLGTGRELAISIEKSGWGGTDASFRYLEPWIAGQPLSIQLSAMQEVPDSAWLNREAEIAAIWDVNASLSVTTGAGKWWGFSPGADRSFSYGLAGIRFNPGAPTRKGWEGLDASLSGRMGTSSGPDSSGTLAQAVLTSRVDVFTGPVGFGGEVLAGGILEGDALYARLSRLGGQETLRGFAENSFHAVRYVIARPEVSLGETTTRLYAFCDAGLVEEQGGTRRPAGAGGGLRGTSGGFRVDAAVGVPFGGGPARFYLSAVAEIL